MDLPAVLEVHLQHPQHSVPLRFYCKHIEHKLYWAKDVRETKLSGITWIHGFKKEEDRSVLPHLRSQTLSRLSVPLEARIVSLWGDHWTCREKLTVSAVTCTQTTGLLASNRWWFLMGRGLQCQHQVNWLLRLAVHPSEPLLDKLKRINQAEHLHFVSAHLLYLDLFLTYTERYYCHLRIWNKPILSLLTGTGCTVASRCITLYSSATFRRRRS